ncbi:hypothetical protein [Streptomyces sp. NRRL F-525]|uniref:hypothetical protein n=1 Tax=Streptomyces sp. NRRL F-525 TaxID=1463861 RepID=UPI001F4199E1|nr:hypothetical protein [Streptomyces sp. NRRL F-525]
MATARQTRARLRDALQGRWLMLWAAVADRRAPGALVGPVLLLAGAAAAGAATG